MSMQIKPIVHASLDYQQALRLRQEVLRAPLGLNIRDDDLSQEHLFQHFGLFGEVGKLLACASLVSLGEHRYQIKQMAVAPKFQRQGLGRELLRGIENDIAGNGGGTIVIEARDYAMGFYAGLGYEAEGEWFSKVGIAHKRMLKTLS